MAKKQDHTQRAHSELPPSSADKWLVCWGWRKAMAQYRELYPTPVTSAAAAEGTKAHEKFEGHLLSLDRTKCPPDKAPKDWTNYIQTTARPLETGDPEFDPLMECVEWIEDQPGELFTEARLDFGSRFGYVGLTGTVDTCLVEPNRITIADLKYGRGLVEVRDALGKPNPQLMTYLVAAVNRFGPRDQYRLAILQPRASHPKGSIRTTTISAAEFEVFLFDLEHAIEQNFGNGACDPGPHCRKFCDVMPVCKVRIQADRARLFEGDE